MKHDKSNEFDLPPKGSAPMTRTRRLLSDVREKVAQERDRIAQMKARATPPEAMQAAPVAPARGTMRLQETFVTVGGGTRRRDGAHWCEVHALEAMNAQARARHDKDGTDAPFVAPFTPGQVQVAADYRALVEWREGTGIKCSSVEARSSGSSGGSGLFIDSFIDHGMFLDRIRARIGDGIALSVRRNMDRDNARRAIPVRSLVDMVVLEGADLSGVLRAYGWSKKTVNLRLLRDALRAALDRMQGYQDG